MFNKPLVSGFKGVDKAIGYTNALSTPCQGLSKALPTYNKNRNQNTIKFH
jgi:hypothetical protein